MSLQGWVLCASYVFCFSEDISRIELSEELDEHN